MTSQMTEELVYECFALVMVLAALVACAELYWDVFKNVFRKKKQSDKTLLLYAFLEMELACFGNAVINTFGMDSGFFQPHLMETAFVFVFMVVFITDIWTGMDAIWNIILIILLRGISVWFMEQILSEEYVSASIWEYGKLLMYFYIAVTLIRMVKRKREVVSVQRVVLTAPGTTCRKDGEYYES